MKSQIRSIAICSTLLGMLTITAPIAQAQTPSITGVGAYDASALRTYWYWSVYGNYLSSGSGTGLAALIYQRTDHQYDDWVSAGFDSDSADFGGYWYESSTQINFFPTVNSGDTITGNGYVQVCNTALNYCDFEFGLHFTAGP